MSRRLGAIYILWALIGLVSVLQAEKMYVPVLCHPASEAWRWTFYEFPGMSGQTCILKTSGGTLWVGSDSGIFCYNGISRKQIAGIAETPRQFVEGTDGTVFCRTRKRIYALEGGRWRVVFRCSYKERGITIPNCKLSGMAALPNGELWCGLDVGVLQIKDGQKILWVTDLSVPPGALAAFFDRVCVIGTDQFINLTEFPPLDKDERVNWKSLKVFGDVCRSSENTIWVVSSDKHVYCAKADAVPLWEKFIPPESFNIGAANTQLMVTKEGMPWFVHSEPRSKPIFFNPDRNEWTEVEGKAPSHDPDYAITQTPDGIIWVSGGDGLWSFREGEWSKVEPGDLPLPRAAITGLSAFSEQELWMGLHRKGIARLDLSASKWLTYADLHFHAQGRDGSEWFISSNSRVVRNHEGCWHSFGQKDGLMDTPSTLFVSKSGQLWAGGRHGKKAATAYFKEGRWIRTVHENFAVGIGPDSICETPDGSIFFGSSRSVGHAYPGGVLRCEKAVGQDGWQVRLFPNLAEDRSPVQGVAWDENFGLVVGGKLRRIEDDALHPYKIRNWSAAARVYVTQAEDGVWMLNASKGLFKQSKGMLKAYGRHPDLTSARVKNLCARADGGLWVGMEHGVLYFDGSSWLRQILHEELANSSTIESLRGSDADTLWLNVERSSSLRKLSRKAPKRDGMFRTVRYRRGSSVPETMISQAPKTRRYQTEPLFLAWHGVDEWDETPADQLQYSYRMNGGAWTPFAAQTQHVYTKLPKGNHRFEVRARNRDLNIDPTPAVAAFMVVGPVWQEVWFICLLVFFVMTLLILTIRLIRLRELRITEALAFEKEQVLQKQKLDHFRLEFFTNISHELRTPLTLIMGALEKLTAAVGGAKLKEQGAIASRNANRLLDLVNQLLDVRKLQEGQFKLEPAESDLIGFVKGIVDSFGSRAVEQSIKLAFETEEEALMMLFDSDKLHKILTNLVSNAIKFTPTGGCICVNVELQQTVVRLRVEDTGPGIDPAYHQSIFERFSQVPADIQGGTGIGLNLTKELVEMHGGTIVVESPVRNAPLGVRGSAFIVELPVSNSQMNPTDVISSEEHENPVSGSKTKQNPARIVVIDDNPDMRRFMRLELEDVYRVEVAEDGEQGLQLVRKNMPDLVISDVMMPKMNGFELCSSLKNDVQTSHIPVILLTARGAYDARMEGFEMGADDYMVKPFNASLLKVRVENLLELRRKLRRHFGEQVNINPQEVTVCAKDAEFLERAIGIVDVHLDDPGFDSRAFAKEMGISRSGFYEKLKAISGKTVNNFIRSIRLKRAAQLLIDGEFSVGEISFKVGFSSHRYFTTCFTQEFGVSPSKYAQSLKNTVTPPQQSE